MKVPSGIWICSIVIGGLVIFGFAMTYTNKLDPSEYLYHYASEAEEWADYNAEQTSNIIWMCVGAAIALFGLLGLAQEWAQLKKQSEKTVKDNKIRILEEKVKKLEEQKEQKDLIK